MDTQQVLDLMKTVAAEVITPRFRALADGEVMEKNPGDLVTVADKESEAILTRELSAAFPGVFVLGEEVTSADPTTLDRYIEAEHAFTVDPVDGTNNFVHGSADHAVMVSEVLRGETVRSWIWQPEHGDAWVAEKGAGVYRNGERLIREPVEDGVPPCGITSIWPLRGHSLGKLPALVGSWFCCGVDYPRLIEGATDYILYDRNTPWDHSPGALMVTEAGGFVGHTDGTPYSPKVLTPGVIVAADEGTYGAARRHTAAALAERN